MQIVRRPFIRVETEPRSQLRAAAEEEQLGGPGS